MARSDDWERPADDLLNQMMSTRQGRQTLLILVIAAAIAFGAWVWWNHRRHVAPPTESSGAPTAVVRIATWNLRFFSTHRREIPEPDFRAIANVIRTSNFDVLAIQEVKGQGEAVDELLNTLGPPYRGTSLSPETGNGERFVFVYNGQHVQDLGRSHPIDIPEAAFRFARHPYQAAFKSGRFDFTLVTCHIFYGSKSTDHARRQREVRELASYARDLAARDREKDVIVLGDFNEQHQNPYLGAFAEEGWEKLIAAQTNLGGARKAETFDNILLDPRHTNEWDGDSGSIPWDVALFHDDSGDESQKKAAEKQAADHVSDHRPAYADFKTDGPDGD